MGHEIVCVKEVKEANIILSKVTDIIQKIISMAFWILAIFSQDLHTTAHLRGKLIKLRFKEQTWELCVVLLPQYTSLFL